MRDLETEDAPSRRGCRRARSTALSGRRRAANESLGDVLNEKLRRAASSQGRHERAIRAALESEARAVREAQAAARASTSARASSFDATAGVPARQTAPPNRRSSAAFRFRSTSACPREFTSENTPILVAELVPAISSYLTIRAATTAMTCALPESIAAAEQIAKNAANEEQDTVEQAPESWDETATKHLRAAAADQTRRRRRGDATTRAFSELNQSFSRMFFAKKK